MYEIFSDVTPSNQNSGAAPVYNIYCIFISCHLPLPQFLYVADPMHQGQRGSSPLPPVFGRINGQPQPSFLERSTMDIHICNYKKYILQSSPTRGLRATDGSFAHRGLAVALLMNINCYDVWLFEGCAIGSLKVWMYEYCILLEQIFSISSLKIFKFLINLEQLFQKYIKFLINFFRIFPNLL